MKTRMQLGDYLVAYLRKIGVTHLFGIPGDLVIQLFMKFGKPRGMEVITFSHEPGAGFAVDGYARATGNLGVLCVTYGAGGHNVVNAIAGSFSERVPILVISGGPGEEKRKLGVLIHHQAKEIESQFHIFQEITCAAKIIDDPRTAATDIDGVVRDMWLRQQPGYIEIHQDMVDREIEVPREILDWDGKLSYAHSDPRKVEEAARETTDRFNRAKKPAVIVGIETFRFKLQREIVDLVEKTGAPCMTTVLAKGAFPMDHPQFMGVNIGPLSPAPIRERVDEADLVLNLGTLLTDMNLGSRLPQLPREKSIWAVQNKVDVSYHTYTDATLRDYVKALLKAPLKPHHEKVEYCDNLSPQPPGGDRRVSVSDMLWEVNKFLQHRKGYMVVAEAGDMLFAGLDIKVGHRGLYLAQGYYASMGFGVPGALGAQIGVGQRPIILCGDGAFQMTGPEICHAPRYKLNPIIILMNNAGWGIFRPVTERQDLLNLPPWPYAQLAEAWGGKGFRVQTVGELREALLAAHEIPSFVLIEVLVEPYDLSPVTIKYIKASVGK
ncbi:MAG TPA: thiamine pyrophosphate-binding protein [Methylomirabilota bacterium]|nr:thiamine pyrophosphate-binding protein [Methylomirabilota bacterium]